MTSHPDTRIRIRPPVANQLRDYATRNGLAINAAAMVLLAKALRTEGPRPNNEPTKRQLATEQAQQQQDLGRSSR